MKTATLYALLEDLKTATLPLYDTNELQAQFQT
eukprot:COSAG05_NODE_10943_length_538_cov_0.822323_2_plen_32_part_01